MENTTPTTPTTEVKVRYPFLITMVLALRVLAVVFLVIAIFMAFLQLFAGMAFLPTLGNMALWLLIGVFEAVICYTLAEFAKVLMDIEVQTRSAELDASL